METPPTRRPSPGTARHRVRVHADPELLRELAALGNNLNQIARAINGGKLANASPVQQTKWLLHLGRMEMYLAQLQGQHIRDNKKC
ncbi:MAG: plasmid mobilization relaxosome protein MobC [Rhodobacteraceae bacterium]|nr:plasmid mobilization relaxosome protein MobC [Paracoccaceae bacterium]